MEGFSKTPENNYFTNDKIKDKLGRTIAQDHPTLEQPEWGPERIFPTSR